MLVDQADCVVVVHVRPQLYELVSVLLCKHHEISGLCYLARAQRLLEWVFAGPRIGPTDTPAELAAVRVRDRVHRLAQRLDARVALASERAESGF